MNIDLLDPARQIITNFSNKKNKKGGVGVIPLDLCFIVSNSNIETTNLGIMGNQKCHVPTLKYILYYTPTHKGLHEPENKRAQPPQGPYPTCPPRTRYRLGPLARNQPSNIETTKKEEL